MGDLAEIFIQKFHNLEGDTVKIKQTNLFKLFYSQFELKNEPQILEKITLNLKAENYMETIFYIDYLIYFKQFPQLYQLYIKGDEITHKKLSKETWFFEEAFQNLKCNEFVEDFLPSISHSTKMKLLKKLPVSGEAADKIFDAVEEKYGVHLATILLPKCTICKIEDSLRKFPINFTVSQQKKIFDKDPNLFCIYLEERNKRLGSLNFKDQNSIFVYVAQKNPELFTTLYEKYNFSTNLGRRTTKNYIKSQKSKIAEDLEKFSKILNRRSAVRKMKTEFKDLFFKTNFKWQDFIEHYPEKKRFEVFRLTYDSTFYKKFGTNIDEVSEDILKIIKDSQERELFAKQKMSKENQDSYLQYTTPSYCFGQILEKMKFATERHELIEIATHCCIINNDLTTFDKVCDLLNGRLKNDDAQVRLSFLNILIQNKKFCKSFQEHQWNNVMQVVANCYTPDSYSEHYLLKIRQLKFLNDNNKALKEVILKDVDFSQLLCEPELVKDKKLFKAVLLDLHEIGFTRKKQNDLEDAEFDCALAAASQIFNKKYHKDIIPISNDRIQDSVKTYLNENKDTYIVEHVKFGVGHVVCQKETPNEIKKLFFQKLQDYGRSCNIMWFLKHEPQTLLENWDLFLEEFLEMWGFNTKKFWRGIKKCSFLNIDQLTVEFCKQKFGEDDFYAKDRLVKPFTMLAPFSTYIDVVKTFLPTVEKVNLLDEEAKDLYKLQGKFITFMRFSSSPTVVDMTLDCCKGDYLKFALSPLYSASYKLPEIETKKFIQKISDTKAVSVKKHALHLTCVIYDKKTTYDAIIKATVPTLVITTKYFAKNPSEQLFNFLENQIVEIKKEELPLLEKALEENVPFCYQTKHINNIWDVLTKYEDKKVKKCLLTNIGKECVKEFDSEIISKILENSVFEIKDSHTLVANIFIYSKVDEKYSILANVLTEFKKKFWEDSQFQRVARKKMNIFVTNLFHAYMSLEKKIVNKEMAIRLVEVFTKVFTLSETFEESVLLHLMSLKEETVDKFGKILLELNNTCSQKFGEYAVTFLANIINTHVAKYLLKEENDRLELCHFLFINKTSVNDSLLIIALLPKKEPKRKKAFGFYEVIVDDVSQNSSCVIQFQWNQCLKLGTNLNLNW